MKLNILILVVIAFAAVSAKSLKRSPQVNHQPGNVVVKSSNATSTSSVSAQAATQGKANGIDYYNWYKYMYQQYMYMQYYQYMNQNYPLYMQQLYQNMQQPQYQQHPHQSAQNPLYQHPNYPQYQPNYNTPSYYTPGQVQS